MVVVSQFVVATYSCLRGEEEADYVIVRECVGEVSRFSVDNCTMFYSTTKNYSHPS